VTHAGNRARRHGRRSDPGGSPHGPAGRGRSPGRQIVVRMLLVLAFGLGLAAFTPGVAQAAGEAVAGTLQTSKSGPIEGIEVVVETPDGDEIDTVKSDENGRWSVDVPAPGDYVVSINPDDLPDGVTLSGEPTRTVTVAEGRRQPVNLGLEDGSRGAGGGDPRDQRQHQRLFHVESLPVVVRLQAAASMPLGRPVAQTAGFANRGNCRILSSSG